MQVGDLVVEHIDDRVGLILEMRKARKGSSTYVVVLMQDGSIERFPIAYLAKYK